MSDTAVDIPALEALVAHHGLRRGRGCSRYPALATGHAALDAQLPGGGLPRGALTEILSTPMHVGEFAWALPLLHACLQAGRRIALVAPPYPPHAPALIRAGLSLERVLVVQAQTRADNLWCAEQLLRSPLLGAVLCWEAAPPKAVRRLQIAAEDGGGIGLLYRPEEETATVPASMAALRLRMTPGEAGGIDVTVLKCRGPAGARVRCETDDTGLVPWPVDPDSTHVAVPASAALRA